MSQADEEWELRYARVDYGSYCPTVGLIRRTDRLSRFLHLTVHFQEQWGPVNMLGVPVNSVKKMGSGTKPCWKSGA